MPSFECPLNIFDFDLLIFDYLDHTILVLIHLEKFLNKCRVLLTFTEMLLKELPFLPNFRTIHFLFIVNTFLGNCNN